MYLPVMYIEIYACAHVKKKKLNYDNQEGNTLTAHGQEFCCLVKILEHNNFPLHTVKLMQRSAVTWVAFEWGSQLLPLPCWDILQLHPMLVMLLFSSAFLLVTGIYEQLRPQPPCWFSTLVPSVSSWSCWPLTVQLLGVLAAALGTQPDTPWGLTPRPFASVSRSLEIGVQGESLASAVAVFVYTLSLAAE